MDESRLDVLLAPYNPWWTTTKWDSILPGYRRPIVTEALSDLKELPQNISVTGPRRVGKTTALRHIISYLIHVERMNPKGRKALGRIGVRRASRSGEGGPGQSGLSGPGLFLARPTSPKTSCVSSEVVGRLSGIKTETSPVFNMTTQLGGGKAMP
jgi:hypothetical protein